jgi:peptide chain release factor 1
VLDRPIPGFRHEAGGHRIQRVPRSERAGRVHSSTVTVSVLDAPDAGPFALDDRDLRLRWFSGTGAGGQHRNKHQNSVEVIHLPTGMSRSAQTRSRETSLRDARQALQTALAERRRTDAASGINAARASQIGTGERSDKRRTLRFQDDRVIDHVTGRSTSLSRFMKGGVDGLWPEK